ncbi:MAG: transposase [Treponema sp.]|nr:transposase [Treponema sp.]
MKRNLHVRFLSRKSGAIRSTQPPAYNRYVTPVTSITRAAPELTLDLYRQRWRIEMAFKRVKSLFKCHETPVHVEQSAHAWFYGKLLLTAICESWVNKGRVSPSAEKCSPIKSGRYGVNNGLCWSW